MDKDLKDLMGFMFGIALTIGIIILISPLLWLFTNWIIKVDLNILGIGLVVIGIVGMYLMFKK